MTDFNDGKWHGWNGGECPVHPKSKVQVALRNRMPIDLAGSYHWNHENDSIVAFRVLEKFEEPKVIWVNEYEGNVCAHPTEERAKREAISGSARRVAVKYVESLDD